MLPFHSFLLSVLGFSPAWLIPTPSSSCSPPVVLLAVGLLRWGGGLFPLASPLSITSAYSQIPLGSGKGGLFINFFPREIIPPLVKWNFCVQLFRGLDFLPLSFPSPLDALERGSFVSSIEGCYGHWAAEVLWPGFGSWLSSSWGVISG